MCFLTGCTPKSEQNLQNTQAQASTFALNTAESVIPQATNVLQQPLNFFQALLSGDRNTIMSTLQPNISSLTSQYGEAQQSSESFAPRGGGRAAALEGLPFQKANQISNLVSGARQEGATGVQNIGQILANLGVGELQTGQSGAANVVGQMQNQQQIQNQQSAAAGQAIGSLVGLLVGV